MRVPTKYVLVSEQDAHSPLVNAGKTVFNLRKVFSLVGRY